MGQPSAAFTRLMVWERYVEAHLISFVLETIPWQRFPAPMQRWHARATTWYENRCVVDFLMELQKHQVSLIHTWAAPNTPIADLISWLEDQLTPPPGLPIDSPANRFRFFAVQCPPARWTAVERGAEIYVPETEMITSWSGSRAEWWQTGRDHLISTLPETHDGIYLVANCASALFAAAATGKVAQP